MFILSQILVGISIVLEITSFQLKERRKILMYLVFSNILLAIHFFLLSRATGGVLAMMTAVRLYIASSRVSYKLMYFFLACVLIVSALTYGGWISLIACAGSLIGTTSSFQSNDKYLRIGIMCSSSLWLLHNIAIKSPTAVLLECLFLSSCMIGYWRYYLRKQAMRVEGGSVSKI